MRELNENSSMQELPTEEEISKSYKTQVFGT